MSRESRVAIEFAAHADIPIDADAIGIGVCSGDFEDSAPAGLPQGYLERLGFKAKPGQIATVPDPSRPGRVLVLVGLGDEDELSEDSFRRAGAELVKAGAGARSVAFSLPGRVPTGSGPARMAQAVVEGAALGAHHFPATKAEPKPMLMESFSVVAGPEHSLDDVSVGVQRGQIIGRAVNLARDLINEPAGTMTPRRLAERAGELASPKGNGGGALAVSVWDENDIERERLGGLMGVAQGSDQPARFIRFDYEPDGDSGGSSSPLVLVGKGITFDSGGLSIKSADGMMTMKYDMAGAATVLATMSVLAELGVRSRVIGLTPVTENMSNGRAIKPGDVLTARNGKTIEVLNTDAEGRLVLADALSLAAEEKPAAIVDVATLTGAVVTALGREIAGLMSNDDALAERVLAAGSRAGEVAWRLPLAQAYAKHIESDIADMKNMGAPGGAAGTITAALILAEFVGDVPWAHLDIAGVGWTDTDEGYRRKGATGYGVRTLVELVQAWDAAT
ncbi:MAG: leucyl aminopeptidase [Acidimicrobiales bacterium]